jgi:citrate lyase subunit beta/citryl-CoA lyase
MTPGRPGQDSTTWLFVPADRPDRYEKAVTSGAHEVIADLEDAVAPVAKIHARQELVSWLSNAGTAWVRVNAVDTAWHQDDLVAVAGLPGLQGVVVPKLEAVADLEAIREVLGGVPGMVALIETAVGIQNVRDIANCESVDRLAFGSIDFAMDIDADESDESLLLARSTLVLASRAGDKPPPIDSVTTMLKDPDGVGTAALRSRKLGFGGKLCIHPTQVAPVARAFEPSDDQIRWATDVLRSVAQSGMGVTASGGVMLDKPIVERARRMLARTEKRSGR